jgi:hypothetical protein
MYALILIVSIVATVGDGGAHVQMHHVDYYPSFKSCDYAGIMADKKGKVAGYASGTLGLYKVDYTCVPMRTAGQNGEGYGG